MKRLTYILPLALIIGFSSCENFLNLEPETSLSNAIALDNLQGVEAALNGAYYLLKDDWVERQWTFAETFNNNVIEIAELSNANYGATLAHSDEFQFRGEGDYLFNLGYQALHLVNSCLEALPAIQPADSDDEETLRLLEAEALFLRGMIYFVADRYFGCPRNGLSVPLSTGVVLLSDLDEGNESNWPKRASIEELRALIEDDLLRSNDLFEDFQSPLDKGDNYVVKALLARAYFDWGRYSEAESFASQVIDGPFSLVTNPEDAFQDNISTENIFSFLALPMDRNTANMWDRFSANSFNTQFAIADPIWDLISADTSDLRYKNLHVIEGENNLTAKYDNRDMHFPYIRLAEMYLTRAESRAIAGNLDPALDDLNMIRERAEIPAASYTDQNDLLSKIRNERVVEMANEGDHYFQLRRQQTEIGGLPWSEAEYKLIFYIPQREVEVLNLEQNPAW